MDRQTNRTSTGGPWSSNISTIRELLTENRKCQAAMIVLLTTMASANLSIQILSACFGFYRIKEHSRQRWLDITEQLTFGFSDQQLVTGIAILGAAYVRHCEISVYHFDIVTVPSSPG